MPSVKAIYRRLVPEGIRRKIWDLRHTGPLLYAGGLGPIRGPWTWIRLRGRSGSCTVRLPGWPRGIRVRLGTSDVKTFEKIFLKEDYAPPPDLRPKLIIDGGAYAGYSAIYFARRFPQATICAVEPERSNCELLRLNTRGAPAIRVFEAALWSESGALALENPGTEKWTFRAVEITGGELPEVRAVTIADLCSEAGGEEIGILKLDVEGAEREIFRERPEWLSRVQCMMIELHERHLPGCEEAVYRAIEGQPFEGYRQGENLVLVRR